MKKILGQESRREECSGIRNIKKKKKAEKWDAQQGAIRRDSVQNAGGEYIKKPILPKTYFTYVVFQRHTFSVKGTQNIPFT